MPTLTCSEKITQAAYSLIDSHLKIWAGWVGLGREVDGPSDVKAGIAIAEVADWWLVTQYASDSVYMRRSTELVNAQAEHYCSSHPELQPQLLTECVVRALTSPVLMKLIARTRYEAIERLVARWNLWPFDKRIGSIWRNYLSSEQRAILTKSFIDWVPAAAEELKIADPHDWRFATQWLKANVRYGDLSLVNAMKALRQEVHKKFESAILESYLITPNAEAVEAAAAVDLTDDAADASQDDDLLAILDTVKDELTPRQSQVFGELRRQLVEEERPKFNSTLAGERLEIKPDNVRTCMKDIRARADRSRRESISRRK